MPMPKGHVTRKVAIREAEKKAGQMVDKAMAAGQAPRTKLAKDVLSEAMNYFFGLAALYQPSQGNTQANEPKFEKYLSMSAEIASKLAPYQSPRLASQTVMQVPLDLSRLTDAELAELERIHAKAAVADGDQSGEGEAAPHYDG